MSIDTLSLARELRAADFGAPQAEAIASAIGRAVVETAATKLDVSQAAAGLDAKIAGLDAKIAVLGAKIDSVDMRQSARSDTLASDLRTEIERTKSSLLIWFIGTQIAVGALVVALIKLIP